MRARLIVASVFVLVIVWLGASPASAAPPYTAEQRIAPAASSDFGRSLDISGNSAVVGAPDEQKVYVYVWQSGAWVLQQAIAGPSASVYFGGSVAIDGDTLVVGDSWWADGATTYAGRACVYVRSGTTWALQQTVGASVSQAGARFGSDVAIDGDTLVVGAPYADGNDGFFVDSGMVWVFKRIGTTWAGAELLPQGGHTYDRTFGTSVAIDGTVLAVGAPNENLPEKSGCGMFSTYVYSGGNWVHEQNTYGSSQYLYTGREIALSGSSLLTNISTFAYVYVHEGSSWVSQGSLVPTEPKGSWYARYMDLSGDTAIVGDYTASIAGNDEQGQAFVFSRSGTAWTETRYLTASDGAAGDQFGSAVAVGPGVVLVGAPLARSTVGSAYSYSAPALTPIFRFYNKRSGTHFYTDSASERDHVMVTWPTIFDYEGVGYWTWAAGNSTPLQRLYNKRTGSHFYTSSLDEANNALAKWPTIFSYDGPTYAVCTLPGAGRIPVYRFYNKVNGSHFYTASAEEADIVIARWSNVYQLEGAAFWIAQ